MDLKRAASAAAIAVGVGISTLIFGVGPVNASRWIRPLPRPAHRLQGGRRTGRMSMSRRRLRQELIHTAGLQDPKAGSRQRNNLRARRTETFLGRVIRRPRGAATPHPRVINATRGRGRLPPGDRRVATWLTPIRPFHRQQRIGGQKRRRRNGIHDSVACAHVCAHR